MTLRDIYENGFDEGIGKTIQANTRPEYGGQPRDREYGSTSVSFDFCGGSGATNTANTLRDK